MEEDELIQGIVESFASFVEREGDLLAVDANERSLTHKIAEYIQSRFRDWNVDCEYNRLDSGRKWLPKPVEITSADDDGQTIYPDIIIHRRRTRENLAVIEVKKVTNTRGGDTEKLVGLTQPLGDYGYRLGLHCIIDCKSGSLVRMDAYTNGNLDQGLTERLAKLRE